MTLEEARRLLGDDIREHGRLYNTSRYLSFIPGEKTACLDSDFTADELEAIAVWMRAHGPNEDCR